MSKVKGEIALAIGAVIAGLEAVNLTLLHPPEWLHITLAVVIAVAGALGIRQNVSPS